MNKALFLDRDGVINEDLGYVHKIEDFIFNKEIFEICLKASEQGFLIIVVTNQSGIGRGLYTESDFRHLNDWMVSEFKSHGVELTKTYWCPHHPEMGLGGYKTACKCRKPNPGMFIEAQIEWDINLGNSLMIGDKPSDMSAAKNAGISQRILVGGETSTDSTKEVATFGQLLEINFANV